VRAAVGEESTLDSGVAMRRREHWRAWYDRCGGENYNQRDLPDVARSFFDVLQTPVSLVSEDTRSYLVPVGGELREALRACGRVTTKTRRGGSSSSSSSSARRCCRRRRCGSWRRRRRGGRPNPHPYPDLRMRACVTQTLTLAPTPTLANPNPIPGPNANYPAGGGHAGRGGGGCVGAGLT